MAAVLGRTQIEIKETGSTTSVPDNPTAKLMYYLSCVSSCVEADKDYAMRRLTDYENNYSSLTNEEEAMLLILCLALSPDKLVGSIFFPVADLGGSINKFFEVKAVSTKLVVSESILIGGQQKKVHSIMMFEKCWLERYYLNPLISFQRSQQQSRRPALPQPPRKRDCNCNCNIL